MKRGKKYWVFQFSFFFSFIIPLTIAILVFSSGCQRKGERKSESSIQAINYSLEPRFPIEGQIIFQSDLDGDNELYLLNRAGIKKLTDNDWQDEFPRVSPDGRWVAFSSNRHGNYDIFVMAIDGSRTKRLTASPHDESELAWTPDGRRIVYTEERKRVVGRSYSLWSVDLATGERKRFLPEFSGSCALPDFAPHAPLVTFTGKKNIGWDIYLADLEKNKILNLSDNGQTCRSRFSPDGRWLVYVSHEADHKGDIFIVKPDGQGKRRLTQRDETYDYFPSWSPDGRFVVFCSNSRSMYAHEGDWDLYLVEMATGRVDLLLATPGRDVFPEWIK